MTFETPLKNVYFGIKREDARLLRSVPVDREPEETPQPLQDQSRRLLDRPRSRSVDASSWSARQAKVNESKPTPLFLFTVHHPR
ncbi:hypothetical protein C0674_13320 [Sporolactobacillus terrae]|uniref:Uncharacterized protein n=1 Tax=Sporolactobacillus terrae TaxID=269673 RepID=A0ABX5QA52_9BACL|nr:hypothetical protein C0674_13320 [Sporolactobacillus terrae]QAA26469.1 hypothetical protein C0679_13305 [Sporolactobacillus terrae]